MVTNRSGLRSTLESFPIPKLPKHFNDLLTRVKIVFSYSMLIYLSYFST